MALSIAMFIISQPNKTIAFDLKQPIKSVVPAEEFYRSKLTRNSRRPGSFLETGSNFGGLHQNSGAISVVWLLDAAHDQK